MARDDTRTVYSTKLGRHCTLCGRAASACICRASPRAPRGDGIVRVRREVGGRRGKTVTTISGVPSDDDRLRELAADLKRLCGSGGSVKEGTIEIQGDHCTVVIAELTKRGFTVKRAGG